MSIHSLRGNQSSKSMFSAWSKSEFPISLRSISDVPQLEHIWKAAFVRSHSSPLPTYSPLTPASIISVIVTAASNLLRTASRNNFRFHSQSLPADEPLFCTSCCAVFCGKQPGRASAATFDSPPPHPVQQGFPPSDVAP